LFFSMSGGAAFALILSVVFHPSLLTRLVLLAIIVIAFITCSFIPFPRCQRLTTRITSALAGSVGTIMAICIFCGVSSWGDVWLRLVVHTQANWEGGQEQGLSAATCILFLAGCASDWALRWKFGEDPDKDWDAYLANYSKGFPSMDYRSGTFKPFQSFWARLLQFFSHKPTTDPILFPSDADLRSKPSRPNRGFSPPPRPAPAPIKFKSFEEGLSDSDDEGDLSKGLPRLLRDRTQTNLTTLSGHTAVGDHERKHLNGSDKAMSRKGGADSDDDDDDDTSTARVSRERSDRWKPGFLRRHHASIRRGKDIEEGLESEVIELSKDAHRDPLSSPPPTPGLVPATPSLIYALDRVAKAQQMAYGVKPRGDYLEAGEGLPLKKTEDNEDWKEFWKEVEGKAAIEEKSAAQREY